MRAGIGGGKVYYPNLSFTLAPNCTGLEADIWGCSGWAQIYGKDGMVVDPLKIKMIEDPAISGVEIFLGVQISLFSAGVYIMIMDSDSEQSSMNSTDVHFQLGLNFAELLK